MRFRTLAASALACAALLAGCDRAAAPPPDAEAAAPGKTGSGSGVVLALDSAAGTVTLEHGEMPELGWPGMTMTFAAAPELLAGIAPGDAVSFEVTAGRGLPRIDSLAKD